MAPDPTGPVPDERLLDDSISAASFLGGQAAGPLPARVQVVVVGGGLVGASTAAHLAQLGQEVLLLERDRIASGSSWHAAGLLARVRGTHPLTELASYGVELYRGLQARTGLPVAFNENGSLTLARQPGRLDELRATAAMAEHHDVTAHLVTPARVRELHPLVSTEGVLAALHQPGDAMVNPGWAAAALAAWAHEQGVSVRERVPVTGLLVVGPPDARRVTGVVTALGPVESERVVLCCGLWTRDLAATVGAVVPLYAAEHVHVSSGPIAGAVPSLPLLRDLDHYLYVRHHRGALVVGAFEPDGKPRSTASIGADFSFGRFEEDRGHFAPVRGHAEDLVPALRETTYARFLCAPESFTPDVSFCLGQTPEVGGLFVAAGFNSQGVIFAPGAGRALAEWVVEGAPTFDASGVDVARFDTGQGNRRYLHERTRESLGRLYAMHWPHLESDAARGIRRTPLTDRLAAAGACLGESNGWERPMWFAEPGQEPRTVYSYGRQNWFENSAREHRAAREGAAFFDLSSFGKFRVAGPDALAVVQRTFTADLDVAAGRVSYTLALNPRGGIELDGTVLRLGDDVFLVVVPTVGHRKALWLLRRAAAGRSCHVVDETAGTAVLHVAGPRSRDVVAAVTPADTDLEGLRRFGVVETELADAVGLLARVSFTGERGYELYVPADYAVSVFDSLLTAAADIGVGLRLAGLNALDSLRAEVGYRHLGHDIGPADDPWTAGLARFAATAKPGGFVGLDRLLSRYGERLREQEGRVCAPDGSPVRRQAFVLLDDSVRVLHHGESVRAGGRVVGQVTSAAYGYTLGASCGLVSLDPAVLHAIPAGGRLPVTVDVLGSPVNGLVASDPLRAAVG
jgi:heterotetrameric sarcosine oxidase gamma subunit